EDRPVRPDRVELGTAPIGVLDAVQRLGGATGLRRERHSIGTVGDSPVVAHEVDAGGPTSCRPNGLGGSAAIAGGTPATAAPMRDEASSTPGIHVVRGRTAADDQVGSSVAGLPGPGQAVVRMDDQPTQSARGVL